MMAARNLGAGLAWVAQDSVYSLAPIDYFQLLLALLLVAVGLFARSRARRLGWSRTAAIIMATVCLAAIATIQALGYRRGFSTSLLSVGGFVQWPFVFGLALSLFYFRVMYRRRLMGYPEPPRQRPPRLRLYGPQPIRWGMVRQCPRCSSYEVRRSGRRGFVERVVLLVLLIRPYRCIECDTRYHGLVFALRKQRPQASSAAR